MLGSINSEIYWQSTQSFRAYSARTGSEYGKFDILKGVCVFWGKCSFFYYVAYKYTIIDWWICGSRIKLWLFWDLNTTLCPLQSAVSKSYWALVLNVPLKAVHTCITLWISSPHKNVYHPHFLGTVPTIFHRSYTSTLSKWQKQLHWLPRRDISSPGWRLLM